MKALAYWSLVFIVGFMSGLWGQSISGAIHRDLYIEVIPNALGNAIAVILVPALLIVLPKRIYSLVKKQQYVPNRLLTSLVAGILVFAFLSNSHRENKNYTFSPEGCEFSVAFPAEPEFYDYALQEGTAHEIKGKGAQFVSKDGVSLLKAECIAAPDILNKTKFGDAERQSLMDMVVQQMQLRNESFSQNIGEDFMVLNVDGYRTLNGQEFKYRVSNYIADDSNFTMYRISKPEKFDLSQLERFEESILHTPFYSN